MTAQGMLVRIGRTVLVGGFALAAALMGPAATAAQRIPTVQGVWRNDDTTVRITVNKSEVKGEFVQVGQLARELGFSAGEMTLVGSLRDNFLHGEQTIRYGTTQSCFRERGRKVPMMGRLREDGQMLAIHFYNVQVDANCRDTGFYDVTETLWERVPVR